MLHLHVCQYEHRKTAFAVSSSRHFTLARWQVARPLQLDCLSKLNPIIHVPRAYSFTYLSSLVIFTATSSSSPCSSVVFEQVVLTNGNVKKKGCG